jgi:hypothetical protein
LERGSPSNILTDAFKALCFFMASL